MKLHTMKIFTLMSFFMVSGDGYSQVITDEMRKGCMPATDYEGCIRSFLNPPTLKEENDFLGMSKIKGWKIIEDRPKNIIIYYNDKSLSKVKVRNTYGRYISFEFVKRWLQEAIAGTSDTTQTIGSSFTNCYGSGYGVSCTTTPATTITLPGRSATPGGIRQKSVSVMIDCLEKTARYDGKGKWISLDSSISQFADEWCEKVNVLPELIFSEYADGSPNEKDTLAIKDLPSKNTEAIKNIVP